MKKAVRSIVSDPNLQLEAFRLSGIQHPFPDHFHEHYVIGLMLKGERSLRWNNQHFRLRPGDILLLNPHASHSCLQEGVQTMEYLAINIPSQTMASLMKQITDKECFPVFSEPLLTDEEVFRKLLELHEQIMNCETADLIVEHTDGKVNAAGSQDACKRILIALMESLLEKADWKEKGQSENKKDEYERIVQETCLFMNENLHRPLRQDEICSRLSISKSTLLRIFQRSRGLSPVRALESLRINKAAVLLRQGITPAQAALQCGFTDQSHLNNVCLRLTGLTPGMIRNGSMRTRRMKKKHP